MIRRRYGAFGTKGPRRGFRWSEVWCKDGKRSLPSTRTERRRLVRQAIYLNRLRRRIKRGYGGAGRVARVSIVVTSWYRTPEYNATLPGAATNSQHTQSRATDINAVVIYKNGGRYKLPPPVLASFAEKVRAFRRGGIGTYAAFVHVDHRPDGPARWTG
jgi:hypothetical protein